MVITRAGLLGERSQGEFRLYFITTAMVKVTSGNMKKALYCTYRNNMSLESMGSISTF